jgi:hypothetical protein
MMNKIIVFSIVVLSAMNIMSCNGMSVKPHKTSVTYGVAETEKDNGKDSVKNSLTVKQDFVWDDD